MTQDPSKWGKIDPISAEAIFDEFADREIFSETKMERLFWLNIRAYEDTYNNMLRIQGANVKFDPLVSKYIETLRVVESEGETHDTGTRTGTRKGGGGSTTYQSAPDVVTSKRIHDENAYTDTGVMTLQNKSRTVDGSDTRDTTRHGTRILTTEGDAARNYQSDAPGSFEETTHKTDTETSTRRSGKLITTDQRQTATKATNANKTAPMTAINLKRQAGGPGPNGDNDAYARVAAGALGAQDWSSASAYTESGQDQGESRRHEEYYDDDNTVVTTQGDKVANTDRTDFSRKQQTNTHMTDTETFSGYGEHDGSTHHENVTETGGQRDDRTIGPRHTSDDDTTTTVKGAVTVENNTDDKTEENTGNDGENKSYSEDWYRHTGRDSLTPQAALAEGLRYLADYPDAIIWLISKLEPLFISVLDAEVMI